MLLSHTNKNCDVENAREINKIYSSTVSCLIRWTRLKKVKYINRKTLPNYIIFILRIFKHLFLQFSHFLCVLAKIWKQTKQKNQMTGIF